MLAKADAEPWSSLLAALQQHRVVRVHDAGDHVLVYPNHYVGVARTASGSIRVEPQFPTLLNELRRRFPLYRRDVPGTASGHGATSGDQFTAFLLALRRTVDAGFPFTYRKDTYVTSALSGSLDVPRTIARLEASGVRHRAVVRRAARTPDAALADAIATVWGYARGTGLLTLQEVAQADRLLPALGATTILPHAMVLPALSAAATRHDDRPDIVSLCLSAADVLRESVSVDDIERQSGTDSFWFTDADALWERALQALLDEASAELGDGVVTALHPLRAVRTPLFGDGGPDIDPDVVVFVNGAAFLVADAKDFVARSPDAAAVYQVTAYVRRLGATRGALFYLSDRGSWHESFGDDDLRIDAFGVSTATASTLSELAHACRKVLAPY